MKDHNIYRLRPLRFSRKDSSKAHKEPEFDLSDRFLESISVLHSVLVSSLYMSMLGLALNNLTRNNVPVVVLRGVLKPGEDAS